MSQLMLDDEKVMSDVNPYADKKNFFPPGTSRKQNDYKKYKPPVDEPEEEYVSPACDVLTMGVGRLGYRKDKCSLSRPLIPGRNIDHGMTHRERMDFDKSEVKKEVKQNEISTSTTLISITCLILLIAIL